LWRFLEIKPEGRVVVRSRDFHRRYIARRVPFEKPVKHFQKQGFGPMCGIGEFRVSSQRVRGWNDLFWVSPTKQKGGGEIPRRLLQRG
jgi:hypothetical protein